jgi:hypothetical protein
MNKVYTITMMTELSTRRLVAICTNIQMAIDIVEANEVDIQEGLYTYAVIEEVVANAVHGIPANPTNTSTLWYRWDSEQFVAITAPHEFEKIINFWSSPKVFWR